MKKVYSSLGDEPEPPKSKKVLYGMVALIFAVLLGVYLYSGNGQNSPKIKTDKDISLQPNLQPDKPKPNPDQDSKKPIIEPPPKEMPDTKIITNYQIVKSYKRPGQQYYTQGLSFKDGNTLLESAGLYSESELHYVNIDDMAVQLVTKNAGGDFAEGATFFNNDQNIIQLTWKERNMYIYNAKTLELKKTVIMPAQIREGWGIARRDIYENGKKVERLYVTDGSDSVHIMDPESFSVIKTLKAYSKNAENPWNLNELEFVEGKLWANVYLSTTIAIIDPDSGFVEAYFRVPDLLNSARKEGGAKTYGDCLNGIAYHEPTKQLLLTGKRWPIMWQITVDGYVPGN